MAAVPHVDPTWYFRNGSWGGIRAFAAGSDRFRLALDEPANSRTWAFFTAEQADAARKAYLRAHPWEDPDAEQPPF